LPQIQGSQAGTWLKDRLLTLLLSVGGLCAVGALLLSGGFPRDSSAHALGHALEVPALLLFVAEHVWASLKAPSFRAALRRRWLRHVLLLILFVQTPLILIRGWNPGAHPLPAPAFVKLYVTSLQIYLAVGALFAAARLSEGLARIRLRPAGLAFLSFLILILSGALVLLLPNMTPPGRGLRFIDALFTATSACCVTGLTVVDTGSAFSTIGQTAVMILIQLGGLGIMVLAAFLALAISRDVGLRERAMLRDALNLGVQRGVPQTLAFIVSSTIICELAGAGVLFLSLGGRGLSPASRAFTSVFHSISAFCNAGFSTYTTNLEGFQRNPAFLLTIVVLLVLGGFGFIVLADCVRWLRPRLSRRRVHAARLRARLSVQSLMVLTASGALLLGGWILFLVLEWNGSLAHLSWPHRLVCGLFMAATPRTAGFSCTSPAFWAPPTILLLMLLMVIGGAPGSTAGGSKVTTLGVIVATLAAQVRGREHPVVFRREIPVRIAGEALVVLALYLLALCAGTFVLLMSEGWDLQTTVFEAASAMGTVGLSLGATANLSTFGKVVICALMLVGRVGPLTVALAVARRSSQSMARYPEERVMIG
jgi:trk system potassium uptake protein TrkH